jgi:hypothetical protein
MDYFTAKSLDQQAYHAAQRIDKIPIDEERENEIMRLPHDMRSRVEYYLQIFYHRKQTRGN